MMKLTLSLNKLLLVLLAAMLLTQCRDPEGVFYLSTEARKYMVDSSLSIIRMTDNYGITEEFSLDISHELDSWGTDGKAFGETFRVNFTSVINGFNLYFALRAGVESSRLSVYWNDYDNFWYDFSSGELVATETGIDYGDSVVIRPAVEPKIAFYETIEVKGVSYNRIIEIDYTGQEDVIEDKTPVISYISGDRGLVKIILKNGVVFERME